MVNTLIQAQDLSYSIPYGASILEHISFELKKGEFTVLVGKNGSGKTTLIDLLMGFREVSIGSLNILGEKPLDFVHAKSKICFLSQYVTILGNLTVQDFFKFHSSFYSTYSKDKELELTSYFQIEDINKKINVLSSGQQRKVQIIAGLSAMPELIIIDEITAVLDPEARDLFYQTLISYKKNGAGILLASNLVDELSPYADQILFINDKKIVNKTGSGFSDLFLSRSL